MPRKQRFKPSRRPKPTPPNEDTEMGHLTMGTITENGHIPERDHPSERDAPSLVGSDNSVA